MTYKFKKGQKVMWDQRHARCEVFTNILFEVTKRTRDGYVYLRALRPIDKDKPFDRSMIPYVEGGAWHNREHTNHWRYHDSYLKAYDKGLFTVRKK